MKKVMVSFLLAFTLLLSSCSSKTPVTSEQFKTIMEENGYVVTDVSSSYDSALLSSMLIAVKDDYQVEFFEFTEEANASHSFGLNKGDAELLEDGNHVKTSASSGSYESYTITGDGEYYAIYRVGNTMVFAHVLEEDKDAINEAIKALNY